MQWSEPSCYMVWKRFILLNKIDAFQIRGLRKILNLPSTFIDRRFTNRYVLRRASDLMSTHRSHANNLLFSHCYNERQAKLLGHIARTTQQDPLRQISFQPNSVNHVPYGKKRHGRPRQNWLHYTKKSIYTKKNCISLTMKRPFKRMRVYSIQPMLDTFNKAGTFGYAYALLPLLTCRCSRVGQPKKKMADINPASHTLIPGDECQILQCQISWRRRGISFSNLGPRESRRPVKGVEWIQRCQRMGIPPTQEEKRWLENRQALIRKATNRWHACSSAPPPPPHTSFCRGPVCGGFKDATHGHSTYTPTHGL